MNTIELMYNNKILNMFKIIKLCSKLLTVYVGRFLMYIPTSYHLMGHGMVERFNKRSLIIASTPECTILTYTYIATQDENTNLVGMNV